MKRAKKTKVIATLGPASQTKPTIKKLIEAGVNLFRFNMKHGTTAWHKDHIQKVQTIADKLNTPIGILVDLQGPEIRVETKNKQPISVKKGDQFPIALTQNQTASLFLTHPGVPKAIAVDDSLLIDDGYIETKVIKKTQTQLVVKVLDNGTIRHRKGVNLPNKSIQTPALVKADLKQLDMAAKQKVDFVALSFARTPDDIATLRRELKKRRMHAQIIAKIESQEALNNLEKLIEVSDAIMVARGDLGIEVPIEQLAYWQKRLITQCRTAAKPVITATQMLQSMVKSSRPTRAEATDVANAVFDGTDAVMLSAETAIGSYPVRSVQAVTKIVTFAEKQATVLPFPEKKEATSTELIVKAATALLDTAKQQSLDAIVVFTETGHTARVLSRFRPQLPIIAATDSQKTVETLTLSYGVTPILVDFPEGEFSISQAMMTNLKKNTVLRVGQHILIIHGQHWKRPGLTNALAIIQIP